MLVSLFLRRGEDKIKMQSKKKNTNLVNSDTIIRKNQNFERVLNSIFGKKKSNRFFKFFL
jgi:hypothetical protein